MIFLWFNSASTDLLVVLLLSCYLQAYGGIVKEQVKISISENTKRPEVTILQGTVQGVNMVTRHGRKIFGFKGIPFAQPPIGNLRFKGPVAAQPWNGTFNASNDPELCPQIADGVVVGNEDCLYLNVFTPRLPADKNSSLLPVMVYIFGGGFMKGTPASTLWGPNFILDKDVVLVVPNYRIGILGFLSTGDEVSPGNYGLKDMVRALEWNRDNIQFFGGDPSQVTLAGGSSGAMSVQLLTLSNLTNGLFHRYITQSGTAFSPDAVRSRTAAVNYATLLGQYVGCSTNSSIALVMCLRSIDTLQILKSDPAINVCSAGTIHFWAPTIEPDIEGALLTDTPANLFATGKMHDLPWLSSLAKEEKAFHTIKPYQNREIYRDFMNEIDIVLPLFLMCDISLQNVTAFISGLKSYYLNDMAADRLLLLHNITRLIGDTVFYYPMYSAAQQYLLHAKSPLYFCSFEYRGTFSHSYTFTGGDTVNWGAIHGDECIYLFQAPSGHAGHPNKTMTEADLKMVDTMVQLWTSFVINGTPTIADPNSTIIWKPYASGKSYLRIGSDSDTSLGVRYNFFEDRAQFWKELTASTSLQ